MLTGLALFVTLCCLTIGSALWWALNKACDERDAAQAELQEAVRVLRRLREELRSKVAECDSKGN